MSDKVKAAFLTKGKLAAKLRKRVSAALTWVEQARSLAETLADNDRAAAMQGIDDLEDRVMQQASNGVRNPGDAWIAMSDLEKEAEEKKAQMLGLGKKADKADPAERFKRALHPALKAISDAHASMREVANEGEAGRLQTVLADLGSHIQSLVTSIGKNATPSVQHCETMESYRLAAGDLVREVRGAQGLDPQPGTQRALSKATVEGLCAIKAMGDRLNAATRDQRGRTALQDVQSRLQVFDDRFARDTDSDPAASARNKAMRLAVITSVTAERIAAEVNDPYLVPRIGQSLVAEYAPEMKDTLCADDDDDGDAKHAILLAQALVMDDPVGKLMTGKINPPDAVQRIRDMAAVADEEPSQMLKLLRQQFEMKVGSFTATEVSYTDKPKDRDTKGNFDLAEIVGELSSIQFKRMVERSQVPFDGTGQERADMAKWKADGSGLMFKPTASQQHLVKKGDTFESLALKYIGDAARWTAIRDENKIVLVGQAQHDLQKLGANAALPVGATLVVPGQDSLLDQLAPYVEAWDSDNDEAAPKVKKSKTKAEVEATPLEDIDNPLKAITPEDLREGFAKLKSPGKGDPSYIQAPGLGQEHAPRKPLDNAGEAQKLHGRINERQYAHLRMLARSDEEDRAAVLAKEGKPVEDVIAARIAERYGKDRVDADMARRIAKAAEGWMASVPLTITFTADRLFSDPQKNAPTHGEKYLSDVELTRGREDLKDLIGRDDTVEGTVGTTGGSKTVTGWKERGDNYMRWRRDKDDREGRHDELPYQDQQIFGAANPAFSQAKGGAAGTYGKNYYGDAHFLLKDSVRNRCAFIVRSGGSKSPPVQRQNLQMLLYDMLTTGESNAQFFDAMVDIASGSGKVMTPALNWEVHLYGGFDMGNDASEIYLPPDIDDKVKRRITRFASSKGIAIKDIGSKPAGLETVNKSEPKAMQLPNLGDDEES